ncbi:chemotaxis protein CheD [Rhizobium sp.]
MEMQAVRKIQICGGDIRVSHNERDILSTVLGSCIAACIYDPVAGIGGMNHYLLPHNRKQGQNPRYGDDAMPKLIRQLQTRGAGLNRLVARVYGGARILACEKDIGLMNIEFADRFLREHGIPIIACDVGGQTARWVDFHPASGYAVVREPSSRSRMIPELLAAALSIPRETQGTKASRAGK